MLFLECGKRWEKSSVTSYFDEYILMSELGYGNI